MQLRLNRWQQPAELQTSHLWWIEKQVCRLPYGFKPSQVGLIGAPLPSLVGTERPGRQRHPIMRHHRDHSKRLGQAAPWWYAGHLAQRHGRGSGWIAVSKTPARLELWLTWNALAGRLGVNPYRLREWRRGTGPDSTNLFALLTLAERLGSGGF